jgi:hypothetical protein
MAHRALFFIDDGPAYASQVSGALGDQIAILPCKVRLQEDVILHDFPRVFILHLSEMQSISACRWRS